MAKESRSDGINLFAVYKAEVRDEEIVVQLAYLLLAEESSAYLDYAKEHKADLTRRGEFRVWVYLLNHAKRVSPEFGDELLEVLVDVDAPYARIASANHLWLKGKQAESVRRLLDVLVADTAEMAWRGYAFRAFRGLLPETERAACLLPYLDDDSRSGVYAAYVLGWTARSRPGALGYLRRLSEGSDRELAPLAKSFVSLLNERYGGTQ